MRISRCSLLIAVMALMASCTQEKVANDGVKRVRITEVGAAGDIISSEYPGKVMAAEDVDMSFRVSGTIERYCVEEGTRVRKGQLLVELDDTDYRVQLDATEAEYSQVKAEAERVIKMYEDSVATPNDYDKAVYGLKQMEAKLKNHRDQLSYTKLYAPFDGIVQKHLRDAHETTMAGIPVISMVSDGKAEVEINLPASEYIQKDRFTSYTCTFNIYPGKTYNLKPISISPKANSSQLYTMRLAIDSEGKQVPSPGMNTMVSIGKSDEEGKMQVPTSAVGSKEGKSFVYLYYKDEGIVRQKEVEIVSLLNDGNCIIESEGLKVGDIVVSAGVKSIAEGDKVEPVDEETESNVGGLL